MSQAENSRSDDNVNGKLEVLLEAYDDLAQATKEVDLDAFVKPYPELAEQLRDAIVARSTSNSNVQSIHRNGPADATSFVPPSHPPRNHSQSVDQHISHESPLPELERYRLIRQLGSGAMGQVYLVHDQVLDRQVALKVPMIPTVDRDEVIGRFYREAQASAGLNHPNICPVFDVGQSDGAPYMTMAYIDGQTLAQQLRSGQPQSQRMIAATVRKIALAVGEAHRCGIVHRDLKPGNIMIDPRQEPILMDFGLAHIYQNAAQAKRTQIGVFAGTPAYMSPEQVECDEAKIGPATDVYSLGVVFYELLTGRVPFTAVVPKVYRQIAEQNPPDLRDQRSDVDPLLEKLCLSMLEKRQTNRCKSMKAVVDALTGFLLKRSESPIVAALPLTDSDLAELKIQLKSQSDQVHRLIAAEKLFEARVLLKKMSKNSDPQSANYALWAGEQIETVDERIAEKQQQVGPAISQAQLLYDTHRYVEAVRVLSQIEKPFLPPPAQRLLQESIRLSTEVQHLYSFIESSFQRRSQQGLLQSVRRLVQLQPNDPVSRYLFRKYQWQNRFGGFGAMLANAFAPAGMKRKPKDRWLARGVFAAAGVMLVGLISSPFLANIWVADRGTANAGVPANGRNESTGVPLSEMNEGRAHEFDSPESLVPENSSVSQSSPNAKSEKAEADKIEEPISRPALAHMHSPSIQGMIPQPRQISTVGDWQLITRTIRHGVRSIAYSPDGKVIAVGAGPYIRILSAQSLKLESVFVGLPGDVVDLCWRNDGQQIVAGCSDGHVLIWNRDGTIDRSFPELSAEIADVDWSPDHRWIAIADGQKELVLWDPLAGDIRRLRQSANVRSLAWRPDGQTLAVGRDDGTDLLRIQGATEVVATSKYPAKYLLWNPAGTALVARKNNGTMAMLGGDGKITWEEKLEGWGSAHTCSWSPDGKQLAAGRSPSIKIYDDRGNAKRTLTREHFHSAHWRPDGKQIVVAGHDGTVALFDASSWKGSTSLAPGRLAPERLAWAGDSRRLVAVHNGLVHYGTKLSIWDDDGNCRVHRAPGTPTDVAWDPMSDQILIATHTAKYELFDAKGKQLRKLEAKPLVGNCGVAWSTDGRMFGGGQAACGEWGANGNLKTVCRDLQDWAWPTWVEKLQSIAIAQPKNGILIWNPDDNTKSFLKPPIRANKIQWHEPSEQFVVSDQKRFVLLSADGKVNAGPQDLPHHADEIRWHPDGQRLLIRRGRRITVIDTKGHVIDMISGHTSSIRQCQWSPDGKYLVSGGDDSTIVLRDGETLTPRWVGLLVGDRPFVFSANGTLVKGSRKDFDNDFLCLVAAGDGKVEVLSPEQFLDRTKRKEL